jgi:hypothetical protein
MKTELAQIKSNEHPNEGCTYWEAYYNDTSWGDKIQRRSKTNSFFLWI